MSHINQFVLFARLITVIETSLKLHSETQISGRLGMHVYPLDMPITPNRASEGKRSK